jgi:hypothetical protein
MKAIRQNTGIGIVSSLLAIIICVEGLGGFKIPVFLYTLWFICTWVFAYCNMRDIKEDRQDEQSKIKSEREIN